MNGIEITPERPTLAAPSMALAYRNLKPLLRVDGAEQAVEWNVARRLELAPGQHTIEAAASMKFNPFGLKPQYSATASLTVEPGYIHQVKYSLPRTLLGVLNNGVNKGRLEVLGKVSGAPTPSAPATSATTTPPAILPAASAAPKPSAVPSEPANRTVLASPKSIAASPQTSVVAAEVHPPTAPSCAKCHLPLLAGAKFCHECGTPVPQRRLCPNCGQEHPTGKFCSNCGTALPA